MKIRDSKGNPLHLGDCVTLSANYSRTVNSYFKCAGATPEIALGTVMGIGIPAGIGSSRVRAQIRYSCRYDRVVSAYDGWYLPDVLTKLF